MEYLKLLYDLREYFPIKEKIPQEFFIDSLRYITEEWENIFGDNHFSHLEYLKILSEFGKHYPMEEFVPPNLIQEAFYRLSKDLSYIIRDNPKAASEYLQVIRQFYKSYPKSQRYKNKMMGEPFFKMSKEIEMEFRESPQSVLIYLELLLINREYNNGDREEHMIERLVDTFRKREYPDNIIAKAAVILIQYNAPASLIERLFEHHPKFKNLFSTSPDIAREVLDATAELTNNERFN